MDETKPTPPSMPNTPGPDESEPGQGDSEDGPKSQRPYYTATAATTRRNANGSVSSVYSGNKIRHLKKMLADVGMDGRFSEAKAREIREMRELQAELEAAQEMNRLWGTSSGGRASRSKAKTPKVDESEDDDASDVKDDDDDDENDDEGATFAARRRRAQADLAFLGDDSDSD